MFADLAFTLKVYALLLIRFVLPVLALWVGVGYVIGYLFGG